MLHPKLILGFDAVLVMGEEHARVFAEAGWDREQHRRRDLRAPRTGPARSLARGAGGMAEGIPEAFAAAESLPKFRPGGLMLTYAGSGAGLFSMIIAGWANGEMGSTPVTRAVTY